MYIERESGNDESDFQEQDGVLPIDLDFSDLRGLSPMVLDGFGVLSICGTWPQEMCFKMCFAPQRRALFRHLNFQKWSDNGVFCTF